MRLLDSGEVSQLYNIIDLATEAAYLSPCLKSKRGVVIFRGDEVLSVESNAPAPPNECLGLPCLDICRLYTLHAERRAIHSAMAKGKDLSGATFLHMRVKDGVVSPTDKISCPDCVPYMLRVEKTLKAPFGEFILHHEKGYLGLSIAEMLPE